MLQLCVQRHEHGVIFITPLNALR